MISDMTPTIIYLAGCKGDWRGHVKKRWAKRKDIFPIDPFAEDQECIAEFTTSDLEDVARSDIVLAYHGYHVFDGLALECGYAHALEIPIVYVCAQPRASSMIAGVSKAVFTDIEAALDYVDRLIREREESDEYERECEKCRGTGSRLAAGEETQEPCGECSGEGVVS